MFQNNFRSGGFVFAEFAIALPLLIFIVYGLATVSLKIFQLGKTQIADYVLESEAQYLMERVTQEARVAKEITSITPLTDDLDTIEFLYHTGGTDDKSDVSIADIWETRIFVPHVKNLGEGLFYYANINAKHQREMEGNPITGSIPADGTNFLPFGDTKINRFKLKRDEEHKKILHVSLEMESLDTGKKIRLNTAVFMPACEN